MGPEQFPVLNRLIKSPKPEVSNLEPIIQIENLSYKPIGASEYCLSGINLEVQKGEFILLLGSSGSGKSMLTRCLNGLIPHLDEGEMTGKVTVAGKDTLTHAIHEFATTIGMVFQNPDDQILSLKVVDEVAWGVENIGLPQEEIVRRVDEFMQLMEISHLKNRLTFAISGGQKQKVSITSNLAMLQDVLVLDDPTTDLDPVCKLEVVKVLGRLHKEYGKTLIIIEHDLNDLIELATRIVVMDKGKVVLDGLPGKILAQHYNELCQFGINMPQHVEVANKILSHQTSVSSYPILKDEAFSILEKFVDTYPIPKTQPKPVALAKGEPVITVRNLEFAYDQDAPQILKDLNFEICQGEFVAIIGANGSGKSTLVKNFIGLLQPDKGEIIIDGQDTSKVKISDLAKNIGYVFQNPDHQLFTSTVSEEIGFSLKQRKVLGAEHEQRVNSTIETMELEGLGQRHPFSLSRGQRQRLAVATALVHRPKIILLDEPTTGQDMRCLASLLDLLALLNKQGNTTIMVTHDMDIVANYATRVIVMAEGKIVFDGPPREVFYEHFDELNSLFLRPPSLIDFCKHLENKGIPQLLTVDSAFAFIDEVLNP